RSAARTPRDRNSRRTSRSRRRSARRSLRTGRSSPIPRSSSREGRGSPRPRRTRTGVSDPARGPARAGIRSWPSFLRELDAEQGVLAGLARNVGTLAGEVERRRLGRAAERGVGWIAGHLHEGELLPRGTEDVEARPIAAAAGRVEVP